jgi:hypothetical protein
VQNGLDTSEPLTLYAFSEIPHKRLPYSVVPIEVRVSGSDKSTAQVRLVRLVHGTICNTWSGREGDTNSVSQIKSFEADSHSVQIESHDSR